MRGASRVTSAIMRFFTLLGIGALIVIVNANVDDVLGRQTAVGRVRRRTYAGGVESVPRWVVDVSMNSRILVWPRNVASTSTPVPALATATVPAVVVLAAPAARALNIAISIVDRS
jgi:hypothetical protein